MRDDRGDRIFVLKRNRGIT